MVNIQEETFVRNKSITKKAGFQGRSELGKNVANLPSFGGEFKTDGAALVNAQQKIAF